MKMTEATSIIEAVDGAQERFNSIAPVNIKFEAEKGFVAQILNNTPYLMQVAKESPNSLLQAMTNVASIGLSLNPAKKEAYLISRNVKVKTDNGDQWKSRIFLEPSYMGLCNLATSSGRIQWVQAYPVFEKDTYVDHGAGMKPDHAFNPFSKDRGEFIGCYCIAKTDGGDYLVDVMSAEEVYSVRDRSESWKNKVKEAAKGKKVSGGPWETDFLEMAKKTVVRRAFKMWPKTEAMSRLENAVDLSKNNEGFEPILSEPSIGQYTADQKALFDSLIEKSDGIGMFTLQRTIDESTFTNLYHSFPKGKKGFYQGIVDKLLQSGNNSIVDCVQAIRDGAQTGDDMAVTEILSDLSQDTVNIIIERLTASEAAFVRGISND
jgi:recombination protein RecT